MIFRLEHWVGRGVDAPEDLAEHGSDPTRPAHRPDRPLAEDELEIAAALAAAAGGIAGAYGDREVSIDAHHDAGGSHLRVLPTFATAGSWPPPPPDVPSSGQAPTPGGS